MNFEWLDFSGIDLFWVVLCLATTAMWFQERHKNKQLTAIVVELQANRSEDTSTEDI
jgi:hypothetical protein